MQPQVPFCYRHPSPIRNGILRPGQFAKIIAVIEVIDNGLLIPQRCVQELQGNYSVFVVNDQDEIEYRQIEVGSTYQTSYLVVTSGLEAGDRGGV